MADKDSFIHSFLNSGWKQHLLAKNKQPKPEPCFLTLLLQLIYYIINKHKNYIQGSLSIDQVSKK